VGSDPFNSSNPTAVMVFGLFTVVTLGITVWARQRTKTKEEFFAAGRTITAGQNGLALAGDFLGTAALLGIVGLISTRGFDGLIYVVGGLIGWPVLVMMVAGPMRRLGRYTLADVVAHRLREQPVRLAIAFATLIIVPCYLLAQLIGAGVLFQVVFGMDSTIAIIMVGLLMTIYVLFGGMIATTWVQIIKATLLLGAAAILFLLVISHFGFNPIGPMRASAEHYGDAVLMPGRMISSAWEGLSLAMGLMFGMIGLPHVVIRFFTVPDARAARNSVFYATCWIGIFYLLAIVLGFGALSLVGREAITRSDSAGNMAALVLARQLGGAAMLGFIGAVTFATSLALVSGLTLSASTTVAHDLWNGVMRGGAANEREQIYVARATTIVVCVVGVTLAILLRRQNVIFLTGLTVAISASANFPALILSLFWRRLTTAGAVSSIVLGAVAAVALIYGSPSIQADVFGTPQDVWFPLRNPGLVSVPASFAVAIVVSWTERQLGRTGRVKGQHKGHGNTD
jgi:cation/acetate symporter